MKQAMNAACLPYLGLVCMTLSDAVRFRTTTRAHLSKFSREDQIVRLRDLYAENLRRLDAGLDFCAAHSIRLFRLSSNLFPFADDSPGGEVLAEFTSELAAIGMKAAEASIRLLVHPDQFVVLSSDNPQVIVNSVKVLEYHARVLDAMGQPSSAWTPLILHGGKSDRTDRLVSVIHDLPDNVRLRLALENDERAYRAAEILSVCQTASVPMIFDAHHHVCHENLASYDDPSVAEMFYAARATWPVSEWQIVHISNGREGLCDIRHSDFITQMPAVYAQAPWIEVEAKGKEKAIARLQEEWLPHLS